MSGSLRKGGKERKSSTKSNKSSPRSTGEKEDGGRVIGKQPNLTQPQTQHPRSTAGCDKRITVLALVSESLRRPASTIRHDVIILFDDRIIAPHRDGQFDAMWRNEVTAWGRGGSRGW